MKAIGKHILIGTYTKPFWGFHWYGRAFLLNYGRRYVYWALSPGKGV